MKRCGESGRLAFMSAERIWVGRESSRRAASSIAIEPPGQKQGRLAQSLRVARMARNHTCPAHCPHPQSSCRPRQSRPREVLSDRVHLLLEREDKAVPAWRIAGTYYESCNCEAICPCRRVNGRPGGRSTYGICRFLLSWRILAGFYAAQVGLGSALPLGEFG